MKLAASFLLSICLMSAATLPSAESLLQKSMEKSGGKAYVQLKSAEFKGTVEMQGHNISGPITIVQQDGKSYTAIELPGLGKIEEGNNGEIAWEMNPLQGARIKEQEEKAALDRSERVNILSTWKDFYASVKTVGEEPVNGKPAWKIEMTPKTGKPEFFYFDKSSLLLTRMTQTIATALGEIAVDATISDYRVVDGIQTPFTMTQNAMGQVMQMHFDSVKYNQAIPAERFALPDDVKALLARQKAQ